MRSAPEGWIRFGLALCGCLALAAAEAAEREGGEQFVPVMVRGAQAEEARVAAGLIDYLALLNARDGGVNGVRFSWEKCEAGSDEARSLQCYQRAKARGPAMIHALSPGLAYALLERAAADRIALVSLGFGRSDAADGRAFGYAFPLVAGGWSQAAGIVRHIGVEEGGFERLAARTVALLHEASPHGREAIPAFTALSDKYGFALVTLPASEESGAQAQWERLRELRPDWVILWGAGAMNSASLAASGRIGYPRGRMIGAGWDASEVVERAGAAAKEFLAVAFAPPGAEYPVIRAIRARVYEAGGGALEDDSGIGSLDYNQGVAYGILVAEAVRLAQQRFGRGRPVTGEQAQWGLERLDLDEGRLQRLGAPGFLSPLRTSCADHEGGGAVRLLRWDGNRWSRASEWLAPLPADRELLRRKAAESALRYASENHIMVRPCPPAS